MRRLTEDPKNLVLAVIGVFTLMVGLFVALDDPDKPKTNTDLVARPKPVGPSTPLFNEKVKGRKDVRAGTVTRKTVRTGRVPGQNGTFRYEQADPVLDRVEVQGADGSSTVRDLGRKTSGGTLRVKLGRRASRDQSQRLMRTLLADPNLILYSPKKYPKLWIVESAKLAIAQAQATGEGLAVYGIFPRKDCYPNEADPSGKLVGALKLACEASVGPRRPRKVR